MVHSVTGKLADILARPISVQDRARAALLLLDWTGCSIAGQIESAGQKMTAVFQTENGFGNDGRCARIGGSPSSSLMAALHNGSLGNILEMDDVDKRAILHAAPTIMPAAHAMAEHVGSSANNLLDAIVIGYEATIRIGRAVGAGHYAYWHNTATCGPFGASAAACHLLPGSDLVSALGLAGTQAAGLWQTRHEPDSMAKQLHAGHAAHAGVLAAFLSAQGFQGPRSILEGEQGFFAAMCPGADANDILNDPDAGWAIHETSLKPYPACRHAHPVIDAALKADLMEGPILIETYADALKFCDCPNPASPIESKFSLQHSAAVALLKGKPNLKDFTVEIIDQPDVIALRDLISVKATDEFNSAYPARYGAAITVGGQRFISRDAYGDPEYPMPEDAVIEKAVMLMTHSGMEKEEAVIFCRDILALPHNNDLSLYTSGLP